VLEWIAVTSLSLLLSPDPPRGQFLSTPGRLHQGQLAYRASRRSLGMSASNGKRAQPTSRMRDNHISTPILPQHEELIKFIYDSWNKVSQEFQRGSNQVTYHNEGEQNPALKDFVPFDLDAWHGNRLPSVNVNNS